MRWDTLNCFGTPRRVTLFSAGSNPCAGASEAGGNEITYQVCNANNSFVCPVTQVYVPGQTRGPPFPAANLTCADITIASTATAAPTDPQAGPDAAFPYRCYALPNGTGSVQYYCGIETVPRDFLTNISDPCAPAVQVCPPSQLNDMSTWYMVRNDTCTCPWNCIDCFGEGFPTTVTGGTLSGPHRCSCSSTTSSVDCRGCSDTGCGAGSKCDTTVFLTQQKTYQCRPDEVLQQFFSGGGLFVWSINFKDSTTTTNGNATLACYANPTSTPLLFTCAFGRCSRAVSNNKQNIECMDTNCTYIGGGDAGLESVVVGLSGKSTVILDPSGRTEMFQEQAPVVVVMFCNASACQFPGDSTVVQSTLEIALASAFGAAILVALIVAVVLCWWCDKRLKRDYKVREEGNVVLTA